MLLLNQLRLPVRRRTSTLIERDIEIVQKLPIVVVLLILVFLHE